VGGFPCRGQVAPQRALASSVDQVQRPVKRPATACSSGYGPSATRLAPIDLHRAGTADAVVEELEGHRVANREFVEGHPFTHVAAMEEHLLTVRQADESVALADHEGDNPSRARCAAPLEWAWRTDASRRPLFNSASPLLAHVYTLRLSRARGVPDSNRALMDMVSQPG